MSDQMADEQYLASAVHYLRETDNAEIAKLLLTSEIEVHFTKNGTPQILLRGSPTFHKRYEEDYVWDETEDGEPIAVDGDFRRAISSAFQGVFATNWINLSVAVSLVETDLDWRTRLLSELDTQKQVDNQNPWEKKPVIWNSMRFSSQPEVEIAKALEKSGVTYLPNCLVRVGTPNNQQTLFPDFLICYKSKWGILEVDGQTYHNGTATQDYERMRKLIQHVAHFDRYPAKRCMSEADKVVKEFLDILDSK